jgi:hypothetical protein
VQRVTVAYLFSERRRRAGPVLSGRVFLAVPGHRARTGEHFGQSPLPSHTHQPGGTCIPVGVTFTGTESSGCDTDRNASRAGRCRRPRRPEPDDSGDYAPAGDAYSPPSRRQPRAARDGVPRGKPGNAPASQHAAFTPTIKAATPAQTPQQGLHADGGDANRNAPWQRTGRSSRLLRPRAAPNESHPPHPSRSLRRDVRGSAYACAQTRRRAHPK